MWVNFDVRGQQEMDLSTDESVIMDCLLAIWPEWGLKLKLLSD